MHTTKKEIKKSEKENKDRIAVMKHHRRENRGYEIDYLQESSLKIK
jgi:hypothetical protein